jgi:hypothetical protein
VSKSSRIKIKRPLSHQIIIAIYFIAPVVNILLISLYYNKSIQYVLSNFFNYYGPITGICMITAPVVAVGLYFVHRISWFLFLAHSVLLIFGGVVFTIINPVLYNLLMLIGNLVIIVIIGFVIRRNFRAPYFQILPRSWREKKRLSIEHTIKLNDQEYKVTDLSESGCFVSEKKIKLVIGDVLDIDFECENAKITTAGEVVRETDDGHGIRFFTLSKKAKQAIKRMVKNRYALRYAVDLNATWEHEGRSITGKIINISETGLYFCGNPSEVKINENGNINTEIIGNNYALNCIIVWINSAGGKYGKPEGFGCKFDEIQKKLIKTIQKETRKLEMIR